jgi:hypothetical protein
MTVASARRPDAGTLIPQQQGDGLELRAHGRRHAAALGSRLDLTGVRASTDTTSPWWRTRR